MKTSAQSNPFAQSAASVQASPDADGFEVKDSRLQALLDLAHDGDEIARAELELIFALA